ncbi:ABC transporter permease [Novosphingobium guangzhouense]|uniref:ABC transporter permease n=1 Tax=Novosphingobium guangzhouense TaxID=1850347 RepID=A0A2K2G3B1_9SPHN|nr:ABC transporter permease [Novosphingobium guangzhouense]PNU05530.1 ABC transporter permease [Novosphingobium guangzhouense]
MTSVSRAARTAWRTGLHAVPTALGVVVLSFLLLQLAPGDAVDVLAGEAGSATAETMAEMRAHYGLDKPVGQRLVSYLADLAHGNLGFSPRYNMPVTQLIWDRLPGSLMLAGSALVLALIVGVALGVLMAAREGKATDRVLSVLSLIFYSVPAFWIGLMLIVLFSIKLGWLPSGGSQTIGSSATGIAAVLDQLRYMILPTVSLSLFYIAIYARLSRISMIEAKGQDYVRTARAKGLGETHILFRHVLRNALIPLTTVAGMHVGGMLGGSVVIETVYGWPGLGRLAYEAVMGRDFAVLLGILLFSSLLVIVANAVVDVLHGIIDPRVGGNDATK